MFVPAVTADKTPVLLNFMEYCEPEPVDYSLMSDDELLEKMLILQDACDSGRAAASATHYPSGGGIACESTRSTPE